MTRTADQSAPRRRFKLLRRPPESIRPASPRPQRKDCQGQLIAALQDMMGKASRVMQATMRPWCSATFIGAQHRVTLRIGGENAAQHAAELSASLRDTEFVLRGHVVADVAVDEVSAEADGNVVIALAVLTIEDW